MVKESEKKLIAERLKALCERHGVAANLEIADFWDDECDVLIPKEVANAHSDALTAIGEELKDTDGIKSVYDTGVGKVFRGIERREFQITVKDGFWTHGKADEEAEEKEMRKYFDEDFAKAEEKRLEKERRKYWKEYILPMPNPDGSKNTQVYLTMAYEPYDLIKRGEKTTEFRAYTENYAKRLLSHPIKTVKFQRGYGGPGRPTPEQMVWEVKSITLYDAKSKLECPPDKLVEGIIPTFFAIDLGKRIS